MGAPTPGPRLTGPPQPLMHDSPQHAVADATGPELLPPALTALQGDGRLASRVFGIPIELARPAEMLRTITSWVGSGTPHRVMYVNAHVVNQSQGQPRAARGARGGRPRLLRRLRRAPRRAGARGLDARTA